MRLHFSIGGYDYRGTTRFSPKYPFQHIFKSFLLIICFDAPESTTNSRSSGSRVDAGKHLFSEGEKNVALSCSFNFNTFLPASTAASRAPCSCHCVSSNISERRILVSNFSVTRNNLWCLLIGQEILHVPQRAVFSSRPHCNSTAEVLSVTLPTARSAIPFVSERRGVDTQ